MRAKARDFLLEQGRERSCPFVRSCDVHEGQLSELRKLAHLPALALAGRAGALRGVEPLPVAAEIGDIGTARMQMDIEVDKRIALLADAFGHFLQVDQIKARARLQLQQIGHFAPRGEKSLRAHFVREVLGDEWRIVVAQLRTEPGQTADRTRALYGEWQDEQSFAGGLVSDHDDGKRAPCCADVTLPMRKPLEGLKDGVMGLALKRSPFCRDLIEVMVEAERDAGTRRCSRELLARRGKRRARRQRKLGRLGCRRRGN